MRHTRAQVSHYAHLAGIKLSTNAPGDGVMRYRFTVSGREYMCLGAYAAIKWLEGYSCGWLGQSVIAKQLKQEVI